MVKLVHYSAHKHTLQRILLQRHGVILVKPQFSKYLLSPVSWPTVFPFMIIYCSFNMLYQSKRSISVDQWTAAIIDCCSLFYGQKAKITHVKGKHTPCSLDLPLYHSSKITPNIILSWETLEGSFLHYILRIWKEYMVSCSFRPVVLKL